MSALRLVICCVDVSSDVLAAREVHRPVHWHDLWLRWVVAGSDKHHSAVVVAGARPEGVHWIQVRHVAEHWLCNLHAVACGSRSSWSVVVSVCVEMVGVANSRDVASSFLSLAPCSKLAAVLVEPMASTGLNSRVRVHCNVISHLRSRIH